MKVEPLFRVNLGVLKYFVEQRRNNYRASQYISSRLSEATIEKYYLGYAPRTGLIDRLKELDVSLNIAEYLGLVGMNDDGSAYETFTDRIIIPIIQYGKVIGFGGRVLGGNRSKYLNSKASILYNKGEVLYPIDVARKAITKKDYAILVEGYFDVLSLADNHIYNVVACCGTAFKKEHALLLKRWTNNVIVCLDGDAPGKEAAKRAKKELKKIDAYGGNIELENEDPDECIKRIGRTEFLNMFE